jgi:MFS family permease
VRSWTERWTGRWTGRLADQRRAVADVGHLLEFRRRSVRSPRRALIGLAIALGLTVAAAVLPALHPDAGEPGRAQNVLILVPSLMLGFLALAVVSAVGSGGGRELLPRDQAAIHPVGATTDHLGALLLAPLNVAWLLQAWLLLGSVAWGLGTRGLLVAQLITLTWLVAATALAQVVAWWIEVLRRGPRGVLVFRVLLAVVVVGVVGVRLGTDVSRLPTQVPTLPLLFAMVDARDGNAAPALAAVMVGYSARLATSTTLTALVFSVASMSGPWWVPVVASLPFLAWSWPRLRRARRRWVAAHERARVVVTVAA